ncbi:MAG: type II toxin-antitoxin system HipA family toxin [Alphaproteobacteria bacterium]|nr:MAG: type II toxin-antitoxin system HipA family toxin [Alphaproteobacteria bacterium]
MSEIEVHIDLEGALKRVGTLRRQARRGGEATTFEYHADWLGDAAGFSLEPALRRGRGVFSPADGRTLFGSIGDSAPDTWGKSLMRRAERHRAEREARAVRTLQDTDYLLGVEDVSRLGALRFRYAGDEVFQAARQQGVPGMVALGRLLVVTERILRDEETEEDLQLIFAPGSSLGGARPKASVIDQHDRLAIAKFPKETDEYSVELWEAIALTLARRAGIETPEFDLVRVMQKPVMLSRRFDRTPETRVPFLSALSMMGLVDGQRASYPEMVDVLTEHGAAAASDAAELFRRMTFNVLVSNVDDHLRNHGFLWAGAAGWKLSPVFDVNPVPQDVRPRILTTNITLDDGTCDLDLVLSVADFFGLAQRDAKAIVKQVGEATATWKEVAETLGARARECERMRTAFDHADLAKALQQ